MSSENQMLLLTDLEAEVLEAALDLYLQARPAPADRRYEYRYRAARAVLANLQRGHAEPDVFPRGDDEETTRVSDELPLRRSSRQQIED
jgi:hypothetical protein